MKFRMIRFQKFSAFMNMAIDEAIMESIRSGTSLPTIRFYGWSPSAISIGFFQGLLNEVNLDACQQAGVDVVRRLTGGGAVYHDSDGEVTYSILGPVEIFPQKILDSYRVICSDILFALQLLGIQANFEPINDLTVDGKKISGNAQTRRSGVLLQHGTILYKVDVETMFSLLNVSKEKISDKLISSVKKRVTSVDSYSSAPIQDFFEAMEKGFSRDREIIYAEYTAEELSRARQLAEQKYSTNNWIGMR
ncbi:MAG TPA: biotin/lipoate A/B protein ligase family protein [Anaerolineaceae bacterium]|nr:biotin/lipoate A/B protein ligase family protein [Anaerolineaceae bacterium]